MSEERSPGAGRASTGAGSDLLFRPAGELAGLIRGGELTSRELVEASLERIEALNTDINAFILVDAERALATADEIGPNDDRPFAGVPIAIKDEVAIAGLPLTVGSDLFGDFTPPIDSNIVRRFRAAGFVIVGRTNMPEFGILPVTEPRRYGPSRNPWNTDHTPGGSSGGSAAAVAAGMVPLAHGADGGGSIRIPAACCGLVGLKPTRGRISRGPDQGENFLVQGGVMTRTVADTAAVLDQLAGPDPGDASWAPPPPEPFAQAAQRDPGKLRIGVSTEPPIPAEVHPESLRAVREAVELLTDLGHEVDEVKAPWMGRDLLPTFARVFCTNIALGVFFGGMVGGRKPSEELVEPLSWEIWKGVNDYGALDYPLAKLELESLTREVMAWWSSFDVLLTPSLAQRPLPIGSLDASAENPWATFGQSGQFTPFTAIFNATGQPAISVPLFHGGDGLPLGVHFAGRPADEITLLQLAAQLEDARPWAGRTALQAADAG